MGNGLGRFVVVAMLVANEPNCEPSDHPSDMSGYDDEEKNIYTLHSVAAGKI